MLNEVKSASGGENTNNSQMGGEGQSLKKSTGMSPVVKGLVGILVLAGVGYGGFWVGKSQISNPKSQINSNNQISNIKTPTATKPTTPSTSTINEPPTTTVPDPTADWKTYENKDYGFRFKYPRDWKVTDNLGTGRETAANQSLTVSGTDRSFNIWVNSAGFGTGIGEKHVKLQYSNNVLSVLSRTINKSDENDVFQPQKNSTEFEIITVNQNEYLIGAKNISDTTIDQILSTFKFTK